MSEVETTPSWGRHGRGALGGGAPTQGGGPVVAVTLVEAPACHLCEDAKSALAVLAQSYPMTVRVVSIDGEPGRALMQEHRAPMSPLVLLDGEYFSSGRLPRRKLEKRLAKAQKVRAHE
jgi:alkyl hydroperoxide reductase subunit AhpF